MKITLPALVLALALAGCRSGHSSGRLPPPPDPMQELRGDPSVEGDLEMLHTRPSDSSRGRVLRFDLRNKSSSALRFAWSVEWHDRAGKLLPGSARAWTLTTLEAGATSAIEIPMPFPDVTRWRLRAVRPG
jgi:hypothetical protein